MGIKIIKTTDGLFEGMELDISIDNIPNEFKIFDKNFDNYKLQELGDNKYKLYNYNYVVIVKEV